MPLKKPARKSRARRKSGRSPEIEVALIGRRGRRLAFGAVTMPGTLLTRRDAEQFAELIYVKKYAGWKWEAVAL